MKNRSIRAAVALTVSALVAAGALAGTARSATAVEPVGPALQSVSVSPSAVGPDQPATLTYAASSTTPLRTVVANYAEAVWPYTRFSFTTADVTPGATGTIPVVLPSGARNTLTRLTSVVLTDADGRGATFLQGGTVTYSGGASGPATHTVDLAAADLTLSGSTEDRTAPDLTRISLAAADVTVGDVLELPYTATDQSLLGTVEVYYVNPGTGHTAKVTSDAGAPPTGRVLATVEPTWPNGPFEARYVKVSDRYHQSSTYYPDGTVRRSVGPEERHTLDLGALTFTVSGSTADYAPPVLTSVGLPSSPVLLDGRVSVAYAASDAAATLGSVAATFASEGGDAFTITSGPSPKSGNLSGAASPGPNRAAGTYRLTSFEVSDSKGQKATYLTDGRLVLPRGEVRTHTLDLSKHAVVVSRLPSAVTFAGAEPGDASATVTWDPADGSMLPLTGYTLRLTPSGRTVTTQGAGRSVRIDGLTNGTTYTVAVSARSALGEGPATTTSVTPRAHGQRILSPGDFDLDGRNDILAVDGAGRMLFYRGNGKGGFAGGGKVVGTGWQSTRFVLPNQGPHERGWASDLRALRYSGQLWYYQGTGDGRFARASVTTNDWGSPANALTPGDFSGDGFPDLLSIQHNGDLMLHRYRQSRNDFLPGTRIGNGWGGFRQLVAAGDQDGDRHADLIALRPDGTLWLYRGNGKGGFVGAARKVGTGFGDARAILTTDFDGGGTDLLTVDSKGTLRLYAGNNRGRFASKGVIGTGWGIFL